MVEVLKFSHPETLTPQQRDVLKSLIQSLTQNKIPFQLTGAIAAIAYGSKRKTPDIDIDVRKEDLPKIRQLIGKQYLEKALRHFTDSSFDMYAESFRQNGVLIDVCPIEDCYYISPTGEKIKAEMNLDKTVMFEIDGITVPVIDKEELITYKKFIARPTDLEDVRQIS